jgi:hypothetical protein
VAPPAPDLSVDDSRILSEVKESQIFLKVVNAILLTKSLGKGLVIAEGKVGEVQEFKDLITQGKPYCIVSTNSSGDVPEFTIGLMMKVLATDEDQKDQFRIQYLVTDTKISFGCGKRTTEPFTVGDVRNALAGIVEVKISN